MWSGYNTALTQGTGATVSAALSAVGQEMVGILTIYVIICGLLTAFGQMDRGEALKRVVTAIMVSAVLTPSFYTAHVQQFFLTTLPNWIAQSAGGKGITTGAQQFDALLSAIRHQAATIDLEASGIEYIAERTEVGLAELVTYFFLLICFAIWAAAQVLAAIIVCIGPFIVPGYLFKATKGFAERWLGKLIGLMILFLLVSVLLQIIIHQDATLFTQLTSNPGVGVSEDLQVLWEVVLVFGFGAFLIVLLPSIAVHIGGGVSFAPGSVFNAASRLLPRVPRLGKRS